MSFSERHPVLSTLGVVLLVVVVGLALSWAIQGNDFFMFKVFAPKQAAVERDVFEQSPSYVKGMVQELSNRQIDYIKEKDPDARKAIRDNTLHEITGFDLTNKDVPDDLRKFVAQLKQDQIENP